MTEVRMPRLSESMEKGMILKWLVADGQPVRMGDELVEIETDKVTMAVQAEAEGVLRIAAPDGATVPVGDVMAHLAASSADGGEAAQAKPPTQAPDPAPEQVAAALAAAPAEAGEAACASAAVAATPLARRVARAHGLDLAAVAGTGPSGLVTRGDVVAALGLEATTPGGEPGENGDRTHNTSRPASPTQHLRRRAAAAPDADSRELTRLEQVIAARMTEAKATIPHFQVQTDVAMDEALDLRARLKAAAGDELAPTINDLIVKACALALRWHPRANASYLDGRFVFHRSVNVGVAVAAQDALLVPVITGADVKSLGEIAVEARRLAERVRAGTVTAAELSGGTFTVSNLGMYGMTAITPVINAPQAAILGIGAIRETLAKRDDEIHEQRLLTLSLSCDHRILYGTHAADFLAEVRHLLETPHRLVL